MGIKTAIEYADSTVNPVMGCTGCELLKDHCYARVLCRRYAWRKGWPKEFVMPEHFTGRLEKAIRWPDLTGKARPGKHWLDGMPRVIFVNDLSDGFCPNGIDADEWLSPHLPDMVNSPHIWMLLTKWPDRMRKHFGDYNAPVNIWFGTTILRQSDMWRLEELVNIKGGKKWISHEPLLGEIDYSDFPLGPRDGPAWGKSALELGLIDFVASGGESGLNARPSHPNWHRWLRDQCQAAGVPYFFKQWGEWTPDIVMDARAWTVWDNDWYSRSLEIAQAYKNAGHATMSRIGKKRAGHLLDGETWREMPK